MGKILGILAGLSIVIWCPWGRNVGEVLALPKGAVIGVLALVQLAIVMARGRESWNRIDDRWAFGLFAWISWTGIATVATAIAPVPGLSLWGAASYHAGLLWEVICGILTLTCYLLRPEEKRSIVWGIMIGCSVAAAAQILWSPVGWSPWMVPLEQQPNGLFAHRGNAGYVAGLGALVAVELGEWALAGVGAIAVAMAQTRILYLGIILAVGQKTHRRTMAALGLLGLMGVVLLSQGRAVPIVSDDQGMWSHLLSGREWLWSNGIKAIAQRPLTGWGFDGLAVYWTSIGEPIYNTRAMNWLLDNAIATGILGAMLKILATAWTVQRLPVGILVYHFSYLMFWHESAQYSGLILLLGMCWPSHGGRVERAAAVDDRAVGSGTGEVDRLRV